MTDTIPEVAEVEGIHTGDPKMFKAVKRKFKGDPVARAEHVAEWAMDPYAPVPRAYQLKKKAPVKVEPIVNLVKEKV